MRPLPGIGAKAKRGKEGCEKKDDGDADESVGKSVRWSGEWFNGRFRPLTDNSSMSKWILRSPLRCAASDGSIHFAYVSKMSANVFIPTPQNMYNKLKTTINMFQRTP